MNIITAAVVSFSLFFVGMVVIVVWGNQLHNQAADKMKERISAARSEDPVRCEELSLEIEVLKSRAKWVFGSQNTLIYVCFMLFFVLKELIN